jgi:hypothetical protein
LEVVQKISRLVVSTLRRLVYLEAGMDVPVTTGYDPLLDTEPELARTIVASVKQRIAFGERAWQKGRKCAVLAQALAMKGQQSCPLPT